MSSSKSQRDASYIALTAAQKAKMDLLLESQDIRTQRYSPRVFPGIIAVEGELLDRAAALSILFQRACRECHERAMKDPALLGTLLRPFELYPSLREAIANTEFFMEFYRIDFYAHPRSGALSVIEVNTSPGSLPEHACLDDFFSDLADTAPPPGMNRATTEGVLRAFDRFLKRSKKTPRTFGLIIREEGSFAALPDARLYARELRKHFAAVPVFCTLDQGMVLELFEEEPQAIGDVRDLDVLFVNPGGSMQNRDAFTRRLKQDDITLLPPRSNLLFTNKSFLTTLRGMVDSFTSLNTAERTKLKEALIPSFPLSDLDEHLDQLRSWEGAVVKRDLGSSGINVHVYREPTNTPSEILRALRSLKEDSEAQKETWTVQAYREPSSVVMNDVESFFEVMVYTVLTPDPSVVFATRTFQGDKANTHFGAQYGNLCRLPSA